jgi:hypothetical protein
MAFVNYVKYVLVYKKFASCINKFTVSVSIYCMNHNFWTDFSGEVFIMGGEVVEFEGYGDWALRLKLKLYILC